MNKDLYEAIESLAEEAEPRILAVSLLYCFSIFKALHLGFMNREDPESLEGSSEAFFRIKHLLEQTSGGEDFTELFEGFKETMNWEEQDD